MIRTCSTKFNVITQKWMLYSGFKNYIPPVKMSGICNGGKKRNKDELCQNLFYFYCDIAGYMLNEV